MAISWPAHSLPVVNSDFSIYATQCATPPDEVGSFSIEKNGEFYFDQKKIQQATAVDALRSERKKAALKNKNLGIQLVIGEQGLLEKAVQTLRAAGFTKRCAANRIE